MIMKTNKKKGLGRGLDALLGANNNPNQGDSGSQKEQQNLSMSLLQAGKYQPRRMMADEPLRELADSIRERGVVQPLLVR